jgi:glycine cleavage system P protein (glycine dehydrogenase) subunit 1
MLDGEHGTQHREHREGRERGEHEAAARAQQWWGGRLLDGAIVSYRVARLGTVSRYTSATDADRRAMLEAIGVASLDDLFADVPEALRLGRPLDLPPGKPEQEVYGYLRDLARRNVSTEDELSFLGAGMYDHYVPALVDSIATRSEFLTPYTPYQPEVSQGGLQVMFEYQTMISELTGLPVSNASVYEGPSAVAAAGYLAKVQTGRSRFVVSRGVHPHSREALVTTGAGWGTTVEEVALDDGVTDAAALQATLDDDVAAVFLAQPNFLGAVEDLEALAPVAKSTGALLVVQVDPMTLAVLRPPGDFDVDIAVGEGQPLGNRLDFGGPSFGFFAAQQAYLRRMPGRIAGETTDVDGKRGFVLTLQTREQHIRREKATSNICTAQALNALMATVYLAWLGREGFAGLGELLLRRTDYARTALTALDGVSALHEQPVVREFAVELDAPVDRVLERCAAAGVNPGYALGRDYPEHPNGLLVAITEQRSRGDIDRLAEVLGAAVRDEAGVAA